MRQNLVRLVAVVAVCALVAGAFAAGSTTARAAGNQDVVCVATGENFPDALGAGPVAALANGAALLVSRDAIPAVTLGELNRLQPATIVIVGGTEVVSQGVANALAGLSFHPTVERLAGADRYATAVEISKSRFPADLDAETLDGLDSVDFLQQSDRVSAASIGGDNSIDLGPFERVIMQAGWGPAEDDTVIVAFSSLTVQESVAGDGVQCSISETDTLDSAREQEWRSPGGPGYIGMLSGTAQFLKRAGDTLPVYLVCRHVGLGSPDSRVVDPTLTYLYIPIP